MGPWRNFEEYLTIDEIMLLHSNLSRTKHNYFRTMGSFQGVDIGPLDEEAEEGSDDLPEEVLQAERAWQEKKRKALEEGEAQKAELESFGLGYSKT
jgi:hypothetical protein